MKYLFINSLLIEKKDGWDEDIKHYNHYDFF